MHTKDASEAHRAMRAKGCTAASLTGKSSILQVTRTANVSTCPRLRRLPVTRDMSASPGDSEMH